MNASRDGKNATSGPLGLQAERTRLAWGRTNCSLVGIALCVTKLAGAIGPGAAAVCCSLILATAGCLWTASTVRYRQAVVAIERVDRFAFDPRGARPLMLVATLATFVAAVALVTTLAARSPDADGGHTGNEEQKRRSEAIWSCAVVLR